MLPYILVFAGVLLTVILSVFITLHVAYVSKTGASPLPKLPSISLFRRRHIEDDDEQPANGKQRHVPIGP